jgi:hypothetical protein
MKKVRLFAIKTGRNLGLALCCATLVQALPSWSALDEVSPTSVVQDYCKLDQAGARLSSQDPNNQKIFALVSWLEEPGWDSVVVIKSCEIFPSKWGQPTSRVALRYVLLGEMTGTNITAYRPHDEFVTFVLDKSGDTWKIKRPLIPPHISVETAIAALNSLLKDEKDPAQIKSLKAGISVLVQWQHARTSSKVP